MARARPYTPAPGAATATFEACARPRRSAQLALGPHANFIKGANGSGKSSILAAIIVALGGNPNKHSGTAGGSKSASGLVREGASSSAIELTLANGAEDPHYLDDGDAPESLVIRWRASVSSGGRISQEYALPQRALPSRAAPPLASRVGATLHSTCRVGAAPHSAHRWSPSRLPRAQRRSYWLNGAKCSARRVREVADHFNLQVENPCCILTQHVSTSFLREAKDAGKVGSSQPERLGAPPAA